MKVWLRLYQGIVHPLQNSIGAISERIVDGLVDGIGGVSDRAIHMSDTVACGACDAGFASRMVLQVEVGVIESATEEGD